jgi:protein-disulfide isomerase
MSGLARKIFIALLVSSSLAVVARADQGDYPIKADDGEIIANHKISSDLEARIEKLPNVVVAANPSGKVTLYEFYDLNCPYCRRASADIDTLVKSNSNLRLVLVPFPVLGIPSILAARIEYAVVKLATPDQFYKFHRLVYQGRGVIDDKRAFEAAKQIGLDPQKVFDLANSESFAGDMKQHLQLGDALGIQATPGLVIRGVSFVGYPGKKALAGVVAAAQKCGQVMCGK